MKEHWAEVKWVIDDVLAIHPDMSKDEVADFLTQNEDTIQDRCIERGWEVIESLLADRKNRK